MRARPHPYPRGVTANRAQRTTDRRDGPTDRRDGAGSWSADPRVTPLILTAIVLVSVATGALLARELMRRRALDARGYDRETGEPLVI